MLATLLWLVIEKVEAKVDHGFYGERATLIPLKHSK